MDGKVNRRDETGIHGKFYEREIALWSAFRCLSDKTIEDFWILSNPNGPEKFDDIVLYIEYVDGRKDLFFLQLKHKETPGLEFPTYLLEGGTKKFQLRVYEADFLNITENEETFFKPYAITEDVTKYFCIYTNYVKTKEDNHPKLQLKLAQIGEISDIVNSSTKGWKCVYKVEDLEKRCKEQFLDQFYLWFNQIDEADIKTRIAKEFGLNFIVVESLIYYFVRRFEPPRNIEKFTKKEMIRKMLEIFFEEYQIPESSLLDRHKSVNLLSLIKPFKITVIKQNYSEQKIWRDILEEVEKRDPNLLASKIDKELLQTLRDNYINLVCEEQVPFFIKSSNLLFPSFINDFMHVLSGVVIFSDQKENISFEIDRKEILEYITQLKQENLSSYLQYLPKISFQGKTSIDLMTFIANNNKVKLDIDILFKYLDKTIEIAREEYIPDCYINRKINIPVMKLKHFLSKSTQNYCVQIFCHCSQDVAFLFGLRNLMEYLKGRMKHKKRYSMRFYLESSFDLSLLRLLRSINTGRNRHFHFFEMVNESDICVPVYKVGFGKCAVTSLIDYQEVDDSNLGTFCQHKNVHVISNNAGEGKTMMLKYISKNFPPEKWAININLTNFSKLSKIKDSTAFIQEIYNIERKNTREDFHDVMPKLYNICLDKKNLVFLIDDYEEIETPQLNEILKEIQLAGNTIWIATRPFKKSELENHFKIMTMELIHVSQEQQINFFEKYFRGLGANVNVTEILKNIHSIRTRMDETFIGIFQQMAMLAEIFKSSPSLSNLEHEIIEIYQKFIELKIGLYAVNHQGMMKIVLEKLAVTHLFSDKIVGKYFNLKEVNAQIEFVAKEYQKGSIVTHFTEENVPIFSHRTYAEYLTAKWFAEKVENQMSFKQTSNSEISESSRQNIKEIVQLLYLQRFRTVRYFFDAILTKELPFLSLIVNKNYGKLENMFHIQPKTILYEDIIGRTFVHFLIGNELQNDVYLHSGALRHTNDQDVSYTESDEFILLTVPKGNEPGSEEVDYDIWFERYFYQSMTHKQRETICNDYQKIMFRHLRIDLTSFMFLSGSLALLNKLLPSEKVTLPRLEKEQKYLMLTHCIINGFNNILDQMDLADLNVTKVIVLNHSKMSLLHLSVSFNNWKAFKILFGLENCLDQWRSDCHDNTILHSACEIDNTDFIDCLYEDGKNSYKLLNKVNNKGLSPFIMAIISNNLKAAKLLQKAGADINHQNVKGYSALHFACMEDLHECAEQLIKWNAEINLKNDFGLTPLCYTIINDCTKIFHLLIRHNAELNISDKNGWTALHHAVRRDNIEFLRCLLLDGANVEKRNKKNETALMMACNSKRFEAVELLLKYENNYGLLAIYKYTKQRRLNDIAEKINLYRNMFSTVFSGQGLIAVT